MSPPAVHLVCAGCGAVADPADPFPFRCRNARRDDDVDHVLRRELDPSRVRFPVGDAEPNPFVRYRRLLYAYHVATGNGLSDGEWCSLARRLDRQVAEIDGHGFEVTPFARSDGLSAELGFSPAGGVWVKDETDNVSGSHKARHLFGVLLLLEVGERLRWTDPLLRRPLAIASCGNAALAAAVVAAAGRRALQVFVPVGADAAVMSRLEELGADVTVCPRRPGEHGDPTYDRLLAALDEGALPFTCQGNLNGVAVEGGTTLGYELVSSGESFDRLVVQVGGGALASACIQAFRDAALLGALAAPPRVDTVQTTGAWPLKRAYDAFSARGDLDYAAGHRSEFMWPWETEPHSVAEGILDDETYDWLAVVEGMTATGGTPLVAEEETLLRANRLARRATGIDVDATGSAGLAGLLTLRAEGEAGDDERVAVLFTGARRSRTHERKERRDEELSGQGHPVAQGLRAG